MEFNMVDMKYEEEDDEEDYYMANRNILLRNYQMKLLEKAKLENTILYLPTGSGKTLIAINVLCSRTNDIKRPFSEGGKRAFFVCTTKVLVYQTGKVLKSNTKFNIACFTGDMNIDSWNRNKWMSEFEKNQVLVLTGDILKILLQLSIITPNRISLIVLDECHHAVGDHPYCLILQSVAKVDPSEAPLLLGLSAILLNSCPKDEQVLQNIKSLEQLFRGKVITEAELEDVLSFAPNPVDKFVEYEELENNSLMEKILEFYDSVIAVLNNMIVKATDSPTIPASGIEFKNRNRAKRIKNAFQNSKQHFEELGVSAGLISTLFFTILFEKYRLLSLDSIEIQVLIYAKTQLNKIRKDIYKVVGEEETGAWFIRHSSPKLQRLISLIKEVNDNANGKHVSTLVFVHQRATAVILAFLLKRLSVVDNDYSFIRADFIVGSSLLNKESILLGSKNEDIVRQFSSRALNVLVSTNILEEGIDISACNVVISFDFPLGYSSYFQSRGRARDKESSYFVFLKKSDVNEKIRQMNTFRDLEKELHKNICDEYRVTADEEESREEQKVCISGKTRDIEINGITAIKAVYRYCSALPQDKYALLAPTSWYEKLPDGEKKAYVQLPVNCPLIEVVGGERCQSKKKAKRSAFLEVVKRLFEMGELDEDLNPRTFAQREDDFELLFPHFKEELVDKNLPQPGTRRRKQTYKVKFAESLSNCLPSPGVKAYLHIIDLNVVFEKPELQRKIALYEILRVPVTFALLSSKKLFKILQFPLFLDMGQINCDLLVNYDELLLTESEFQDIKTCHFALFKRVTRVLKTCQVFDNENKEHSFFIVPVQKNSEDRFVLNWDLIRCDYCKNSDSALMRYNPTSNRSGNSSSIGGNITLEGMYALDTDGTSNSLVPYNGINGRFLWAIDSNEKNEEPRFVMTEADYRYFVIFPNYRKQDPPPCYIVNKFCHDMSPLSPFPGAYEDYVSYYRHKYEIEITNMKQPLLRVSPLYSCSNFNKPRNRKTRRDREKYMESEEHFVPELCDVIPFDRQFWLKALLLPTVLNRICHVYCVEEFRRKMAAEIGLEECELPPGKTWKPLSVDAARENEKETWESATKTVGSLKSSLPLSKLKDKSQANQKVILDPERHMYDIGLCDLEFYVRKLEEVDEEEFNADLTMSRNNDEIIKLIGIHKCPVPTLRLLGDRKEKLGPDLAQMIQACTSKSANDIVDYERLEILGDSFLKFATTLFLFRNYKENEGILTSIKGKIVGNRNLLYCGLAKNVQDAINVNDFAPLSDWNPPLLQVPKRLAEAIIARGVDPAVLHRFDISVEEQFSGVLSEKTWRTNEEIVEQYEKCYEMPASSLLPYKTVEDKTVADCVEALIGIYLLTLGLPGAFEFLLWMEILPRPKGSYSELMEQPYQPRLLRSEDNIVVMNLLSVVFYSELEDILNYNFRNKALLLEALTHPSYFKNRTTDCYQRLELLGDAILDFLITAHVYENCGNLSPGDVTDIRSALVNNVTFACLVVRYELHKYLLSFSATLKTSIENFVSFQVNRNHAIDDNVVILLEENDCTIAETVQVPKALGDLFESLAGAIYLDSGNSLDAVWQVYYRLMKREIDGFTQTVPKSCLRLLNEICGDRPLYEVTVVGKMVKILCTVYYENCEIKGHGFGLNKKEAKQSAARVVLNKILRLKK